MKSEAVIQSFLGLNFWKVLKIVCDRVMTVTFSNTERSSAKEILRMVIPWVHLELCQISLMVSFCKNFLFVIDIWQVRNAFELVGVSHYKGV